MPCKWNHIVAKKDPESPVELKNVFSFPYRPGAHETVDVFFDAAVKTDKKAIVIITYNTGATDEELIPFIKKCKDHGINIFLLSDNPANDFGIQTIKYETTQKAIEAGAIPLRNPNVNNQWDVQREIQRLINQGKIGEELNKSVIEQFGTPPPLTPRTS